MQKPGESSRAAAMRSFFRKWKIPQPLIADLTEIAGGTFAQKFSLTIPKNHLKAEDEEKIIEVLKLLQKDIESILDSSYAASSKK